jgi:hypothetical protein
MVRLVYYQNLTIYIDSYNKLWRDVVVIMEAVLLLL